LPRQKGSNLTTSSTHEAAFNFEEKIHHHVVASQIWPKLSERWGRKGEETEMVEEEEGIMILERHVNPRNCIALACKSVKRIESLLKCKWHVGLTAPSLFNPTRAQPSSIFPV
jgi:hypothetical protein